MLQACIRESKGRYAEGRWETMARIVFAQVFGAGVAFAVTALLVALKMRTRVRQIEAFLAPYRRGDYRTALQMTEVFRSVGKIREYHFFRGGTLARLGDLEGAQRELEQARTTVWRVTVRDDPCRTRFDLCKEGTISGGENVLRREPRREPNRGSTHRQMAEACLLKGDRSSDAVRWAKLAVDEDRAAKQVPIIYDMNLSEDLATLAWAVAVDSADRSRVQGLVAEALERMPDSVYTRAQVLYQSGRAYRAMGDEAESLKMFRQAAEIDSQGELGREARAMAQSITS